VLMTTPAVRHLAECLPDLQLDFLTGKKALPLIAENDYLFNRYFIDEQTLFGWKKHLLFPLLAQLKDAQHDAACVFAPGSTMIRLLSWAGIKRIYAPLEEPVNKRLSGGVPWKPFCGKYIGELYANLARYSAGMKPLDSFTDIDMRPDLKVPEAARVVVEKLLQKLNVAEIPYMLVAPGGGHNSRQEVPQKRWLPERFAEVTARICMEYGLLPILVGDEHDKVDELWDGTGLNFTGGLTVSTLSALVERSRFVLCNDSLVMHMALALERPFIAVFGPSDPKSLLPETHQEFAVTPSGMACVPCYANSAFGKCQSGLGQTCMNQIGVEEVFLRCKEVMNGAGGMV
jgi:heptosyltransferase-2